MGRPHTRKSHTVRDPLWVHEVKDTLALRSWMLLVDKLARPRSISPYICPSGSSIGIRSDPMFSDAYIWRMKWKQSVTHKTFCFANYQYELVICSIAITTLRNLNIQLAKNPGNELRTRCQVKSNLLQRDFEWNKMKKSISAVFIKIKLWPPSWKQEWATHRKARSR